MCFLPQDEAARDFVIAFFEKFIAKEGQHLVGWRDVPTTLDGLGKTVIEQMPVVRQCLIRAGRQLPGSGRVRAQAARDPQADPEPAGKAHGRKAWAARRDRALHAELLAGPSSTRGCCWPIRSARFYDDLRDPDCVSALGLVHQRFSTNTFPSWKLAHPYRFIAHNGEINTVRGNVNWMNARRRTMESELLGPDLDKMWPLIPHGQSDTACLDNALELLLAGGYSLAHAVMMLIPEAWAGNPLMSLRAALFMNTTPR